MFKQKFIPLIGAALMLASCGCSNSTINIDHLIDIEGFSLARSEKFNIAKGATYFAYISYNVFKDTVDEPSNLSFFYKGDVETAEDLENIEPVNDVIDSDSLKITCNNKELKKYNGDVETWIENVGEDKEFDNTFVFASKYDKFLAPVDTILTYSDENTKISNVKITFTAKESASDLHIAFAPTIVH